MTEPKLLNIFFSKQTILSKYLNQQTMQLKSL